MKKLYNKETKCFVEGIEFDEDAVLIPRKKEPNLGDMETSGASSLEGVNLERFELK